MKLALGLFGVLTVVSIGLGLTTVEDDLLRRANAAFDRGEFENAIALYERLEDRTDDPGQTAFNKATALYRLGRFREAELHYRRALEGAEGRRRSAALFGLGNSLVQQEASLGAPALREAIQRYEECLTLKSDEPAADDVRHNLELARLLWLQRKSDPQKPDRSSPDNGSDNQPPDRGGTKPMNGGSEEPRPNQVPKSIGDPMRVQPEPGATPIKTDDVAPGKGTLPPVPDTDELRSMTTEDATEHLRRATLKVLSERRVHERAANKPTAAGVKDW